jgi:hypothetical protein
MSAPGIITDTMTAIKYEPLYRPTPGMLAKAKEDTAYAEKLRSVLKKRNEGIRARNAEKDKKRPASAPAKPPKAKAKMITEIKVDEIVEKKKPVKKYEIAPIRVRENKNLGTKREKNIKGRLAVIKEDYRPYQGPEYFQMYKKRRQARKRGEDV